MYTSFCSESFILWSVTGLLFSGQLHMTDQFLEEFHSFFGDVELLAFPKAISLVVLQMQVQVGVSLWRQGNILGSLADAGSGRNFLVMAAIQNMLISQVFDGNSCSCVHWNFSIWIETQQFYIFWAFWWGKCLSPRFLRILTWSTCYIFQSVIEIVKDMVL